MKVNKNFNKLSLLLNSCFDEIEKNNKKPTKSELEIEKINKIKNRYLRTSTLRIRNSFKSSNIISNLNIKESLQKSLPLFKIDIKNRKKEEMKDLLPILLSCEDFMDFMCSKEYEEDLQEILLEFACLLNYKSFPDNFIIRKSGDKSNEFFLILDGNVTVLNLIFEKECLSEEEYITYLIKMDILNENYIIDKCIQLNYNLMNIENHDFKSLCKKFPHFNYDEFYSKAYNNLINKGFNLEDYKGKIPNINDYINATKIEKNIKALNNNKNILKNTIKKFFIIPHYKIVSVYNRGRYFGDLNDNYNILDNYCFISNNKCEIGYIDTNICFKSNRLYKLLERKMKNIFRSNIDFYFIFQKINFEIFLNDYAKLFTYKLYKKGEKLLIQNAYSEGVFLIRVGRIRVYTERNIDEIGGLIMSLEYCLEGYSEHISSLHKGNIINNEEKNRLKNPIYKTKEYLENSKGKKIIEMDTFNEKEILGLNEFYDYKSQFNLFTAECLTDCIIFYLPKKMMNIIVGKENSVKYHVLNLIELKAKYYIGKLKNYRDNFIKEIGFKLGYTQNQIENIYNLKVKEKNNSNDLINLRKNFNKVYSKMSYNLFDVGNNSFLNKYNNLNPNSKNNIFNKNSNLNLGKTQNSFFSLKSVNINKLSIFNNYDNNLKRYIKNANNDNNTMIKAYFIKENNDKNNNINKNKFYSTQNSFRMKTKYNTTTNNFFKSKTKKIISDKLNNLPQIKNNNKKKESSFNIGNYIIA